MTTAEEREQAACPDRLVKIPEVLEMLGVCESTYYKYRAEGLIPKPIQTPFGPRYRVSRLLELIEVWASED